MYFEMKILFEVLQKNSILKKWIKRPFFFFFLFLFFKEKKPFGNLKPSARLFFRVETRVSGLLVKIRAYHPKAWKSCDACIFSFHHFWFFSSIFLTATIVYRSSALSCVLFRLLPTWLLVPQRRRTEFDSASLKQMKQVRTLGGRFR
jgi:hypothetical protein